MKLETQELLCSEAAHLRAPARGWQTTLPAIAAAIVGIFLIYRDTARSMVAIWAGSDTFAHGYLIAPIALVLVWMKRRELAKLFPAPDYLGFLLLAAAGLAWLVAAAGHVQVLKQYAMTAMIPAAVLALAGRRVTRALAFPLGFLLLAVPVGDAFLPLLMDWTADFTVAALRMTRVPVYREGTFFTIPSGQWSVVEACSGLRYLIASVTVGALYAYLSYRHLWKRALFIGLSVAVPIFANFLRAYMIVMIGHLSDMRLAIGVDHFIYGWVFFGVVMVLLLSLGALWRDPAPASHERYPSALVSPRASKRGTVAAVIGVAALLAPWPLYAHFFARSDDATIVLRTPVTASGWSRDSTRAVHWRPHYAGPVAELFEVYNKDGRAVTVYVAYYRRQRQGAELVSSQNTIAGDPRSAWASMGQSLRREHFSKTVALRQTRLRSAGARLLVWDWYRIAGRDVSDPYLAKALLARERLLGRGDDSAAILMATSYDERPEIAADTLRQFAREMLPSIDAALATAIARHSE